MPDNPDLPGAELQLVEVLVDDGKVVDDVVSDGKLHWLSKVLRMLQTTM